MTNLYPFGSVCEDDVVTHHLIKTLVNSSVREKRGMHKCKANYKRQLPAEIDRVVIRKIALGFISSNWCHFQEAAEELKLW